MSGAIYSVSAVAAAQSSYFGRMDARHNLEVEKVDDGNKFVLIAVQPVRRERRTSRKWRIFRQG